ncbi:MAG: transposase [Candidatus Magasanikbacteria bacterium]|nr:transposase [Candidatus Magasanikbacteria bacterium]
MRIFGIEAIHPKHRTTVPAPGHKIYPYLLRNVPIIRSNQVWSTDITYIPLEIETAFCARALKSALARAVPEIHNSDQGSQFTSNEYAGILEANKIQISMDGRGRCLDNIFVERLWRTVKYEDIYLKHYCTMQETYEGLQNYFPFYNQKRRHQSLNYKTPEIVYHG